MDDVGKYEKLYSECYVLDKVIWDKYDMKLTKINVVKIIQNYKELKSKYIHLAALNELGLTAHNIENIHSKNFSNNTFNEKIDIKIDLENDLKFKAAIFDKLNNCFTEDEKQYYDYCLQNNKSEEHLRNHLGGLSKLGLLPIKNSCILKIALAFDKAVVKK